jgi:protein-S-isoprenylcysteine O-methyltransferase Ste14
MHLPAFTFLPNPKFAIIFWIAFVIWVLPEIFGWNLKRPAGSAVARDRGSLNIISALWSIGIVGGFYLSSLFPNALITSRQPALFCVGICFMLAGVAFRWYSVSVLGKYFSFNVAIHNNHVLIERGPYRYVRHPSYSGALVSLLGFGLALGNWASLVVSFSCLALAYAYRIPVEESALHSAFGEKYLQYRQKTWRLVPFVF